MVASSDTSNHPETAKRSLTKGEEDTTLENMGSQSNAYPNLNKDMKEEEQEIMKEKLDKAPNPPPEYPFVTRDSKIPWKNKVDIGDEANGKLPRYSNSLIYKQNIQMTSLESDFEGKMGCFQRVSEGIVSGLFDVLWMFLELMINIWLALLLKDQGSLGQYQGIIAFFFVPSMVNALIWVKLSKYYPSIDFFFMIALVFFGFPSPMFVYIWHLYLTAFCDQISAQRSKILANCFRIVQAFCCSLPLLILNLYTLMAILKMEGKEEQALDISQLTSHLDEGINVKIHGLAALLSFINVLRAASIFNERKTFTLLFVMVGYPFLLFSILSRILAIGVIACFMDVWWTVILFLGLVSTNLALYAVCRKRDSVSVPIMSGLPSTPQMMRIGPRRGDIEEQMELRSKILEKKANNDHVSTWNWIAQDERSFWKILPKLFLMSVCSIVIPVGYTNDYRSHHPRIKGGLFILLNYFFNMIWIGLALGFTIINDIPNTFHGVSLPQPSLKVEVPGSKVIVQAGGLDVALNLPNTQIDLGSMPTFSATLNTDSQDLMHAIVFPVALAIITIPFVIMRAAMMELDCFLARKKQIEIPPVDSNSQDQVDGFFSRRDKKSLSEAVRSNGESKELKARLYLTVCCSICGMCVFTVLLVLTVVFTMLNFV